MPTLKIEAEFEGAVAGVAEALKALGETFQTEAFRGLTPSSRFNIQVLWDSTDKDQEVQSSLLSLRVSDLGVRPAVYNQLYRSDIRTVGDIMDRSRTSLLAVPYFGKKRLEELERALESRGLHLRS